MRLGTTLAIGAFCSSLLPTGLPLADSECGPGSHWTDACTAATDVIDTVWTAQIDTWVDGNLDCQADLAVVVHGSMRINRSAAKDDSSNFPGLRSVDGHLDVIDTEIVSLSVTNGASVSIVAGAGFGSGGILGASKGAIAEQALDSALADSFYDVLAEANLDGALVYNLDPIRIEAAIDRAPTDAAYGSVPPTCVAGFLDPAGQVQVGNLVGLQYTVQAPPPPIGALSDVPCIGGLAGPFPCNDVDLLALVPLTLFDAGPASDIWGWTSSAGIDYAIIGLSEGTGFVELSDPKNPVYLGLLPTHSTPSPWRDIKTEGDYAFIVSEAHDHGMQIFDLTQLSTVVAPPVTFAETAHYGGFGEAHNLAINEGTRFAYAIGVPACFGGLSMIDLASPLAPVFAGCTGAFIHDAQCVVYAGPDSQHQGSEICFNSEIDALTIVDVTNKGAPVQLSTSFYAQSAYTHQGWLTEDHRYFLLGDELDETTFFNNTRTFVWDVSDLEVPLLVGLYEGPTKAIDHNLYVSGNHVFEANYRSGLRILEIGDLSTLGLSEVAFFDTVPADDLPALTGAWSVYPFFDSGTVVVSDMINGLFVLQPGINSPPVPVPALTIPYFILLVAMLAAAGLWVAR